MKKKILIGSLLVLTLLLLMPSIPAIQQKTIEEGFKQDIQEKLETINLEEIKDIRSLIDALQNKFELSDDFPFGILLALLLYCILLFSFGIIVFIFGFLLLFFS